METGDTDTQTLVQVDKKTFTVGQRTFTWSDDLSFWQLRYLYRAVKGYTIANLTNDQLVELLAEKLTAILAAILIERGTTMEQKVAKGEKGYLELVTFLDTYLKPTQAAEMVSDFFVSGRLIQVLTGLTDMLPKQAIPPNGSKTP